MKCSIYILFFLCFSYSQSSIAQNESYIYDTSSLKIKRLTANTYLHISYLKTENWGNVACNGMIVVNSGKAAIIDSPVGNTEAEKLINWVEKSLKAEVIGVLATHFHIDCLGGLSEFQKRMIPTYASERTIDLVKLGGNTIPEFGFDDKLELRVGEALLVNEFLGEGHTSDNVVSYFPSEKVLFGGCLIKEVGAGKGNLADANIYAWSKTVGKVKAKYNEAEFIIPGHGELGGQELLDYTITLFKENTIKIQWFEEVEGDFSFKENWSYNEGVYKNQFGQLSCDGICPPEIDRMKTNDGMIIQDSLQAFYELVDTTHLFHSLSSEAMTYEWTGVDFMTFTKNEDTIIGYSICNVSTHSSLQMKIHQNELTASINFNSIRDLGVHAFPLTDGFIKIDRSLFEQGIIKAQFDLTFENTMDPHQSLFWKGLIYSKIEE